MHDPTKPPQVHLYAKSLPGKIMARCGCWYAIRPDGTLRMYGASVTLNRQAVTCPHCLRNAAIQGDLCIER